MFPRIASPTHEKTTLEANTQKGTDKIDTHISVGLKKQKSKIILPSRCKPRYTEQKLQTKRFGNNRAELPTKYFPENCSGKEPKKMEDYLRYSPSRKLKTLDEDLDQLAYWRKKRIESSQKRKNQASVRSRMNAHNISELEDQLMVGNRRRMRSLDNGQIGRDTLRMNQNLSSISSHQNRLYPPRRYFKSSSKQAKSSLANYSPPTRRRKIDTPMQMQINSDKSRIKLVDEIIHGESPTRQKNRQIKLFDDLSLNESRNLEDPENKEEKQAQRLFKYRTFYAKKKEEEKQETQEEKKKQIKIFDIDFPRKQKINEAIKFYEPLTKTVILQNEKHLTKEIQKEYSDTPGQQFLYFGQKHVETSKREGFGVLVTPKFIKEGLWVNGEIVEGAELQKKYLYKGEFQDGQRHGKGICEWVNGEIYEGDWAFDKRNGYGIWTSKCKEKYKGDWVDNKAHGFGIMENEQTGTYKGQFFQFIKNGNGHEKLLNGDEYFGGFREGEPHGKGTYVWENGMKYEGDFRYGLRKGNGKQYKDNIFYLQGRFIDEFPHGICRLRLHNQQSTQINLEKGVIKKYQIL